MPDLSLERAVPKATKIGRSGSAKPTTIAIRDASPPRDHHTTVFRASLLFCSSATLGKMSTETGTCSRDFSQARWRYDTRQLGKTRLLIRFDRCHSCPPGNTKDVVGRGWCEPLSGYVWVHEDGPPPLPIASTPSSHLPPPRGSGHLHVS